MNTELTERYLRAAIAGLPAATQDDVRTELTALIMDATEARIDQGEEPPAAERAVLTELGDPAILAAEYADRPLHLIGPRYFLVWRRLLKLLLWIVPAVAVVGVAISQALVDAPLGTLIGSPSAWASAPPSTWPSG
ncbi:permease prefix domain 1-containing protein [Brachybacterium sp. Z12]|uniref:permease prefix domain 1-containing protein n=1 Tax=Brachybacterium sp. Z12 TaxID=2759167 RepID=UPI00223BDEE3|nr:permease prefix domain 1-containing protein [Brachybacterium sp. Z12]